MKLTRKRRNSKPVMKLIPIFKSLTRHWLSTCQLKYVLWECMCIFKFSKTRNVYVYCHHTATSLYNRGIFPRLHKKSHSRVFCKNSSNPHQNAGLKNITQRDIWICICKEYRHVASLPTTEWVSVIESVARRVTGEGAWILNNYLVILAIIIEIPRLPCSCRRSSRPQASGNSTS